MEWHNENCTTQIADLPFARTGMTGGWAGGQAIVCGGTDEDEHMYNDCRTYDPV